MNAGPYREPLISEPVVSRTDRSPVLAGGVGLLFGGIAVSVAWHCQFKVAEWHHGLAGLIFSALLVGWAVGARATERMRHQLDSAEKKALLAWHAFESERRRNGVAP